MRVGGGAFCARVCAFHFGRTAAFATAWHIFFARSAYMVHRVVIPSPHEMRSTATVFEVKPSKVGGLGVFARSSVRPYTFVGTYPGMVYKEDEFERMAAQNPAFSTYAVQFFRGGSSIKTANTRWLITPGNARGTILPEFKGAITPFVNEPPPGKLANVIWVWNFATNTVEMFTNTYMRAGQELFVCYGQNYARSYPANCESLWALGYRRRLSSGQAENKIRFVGKSVAVTIGTNGNNTNNNSNNSANTVAHIRPRPNAQANRANRVAKRRRQNSPAAVSSRPVGPVNAFNTARWLVDMRALIDKPRYTAEDTKHIRALAKVYQEHCKNASCLGAAA